MSTYETYDMLQWLDNKELHPITEKGHKYSWSNREGGERLTLTKMDHAIGNIHWLNKFIHASVLYAKPQTSDHTPLILSLRALVQTQRKPFRFFNYLCEHQDFLRTVDEAWKIWVKGVALQKIWHKLNNVKSSLEKLHSREFAGITGKIKEWEENLDNIQPVMQDDPSNILCPPARERSYLPSEEMEED